ncbi:NUDIX hydrolase [Prauserella flavalba]|uniref:7,8-dihydro-8-oxoguanine-triphosphatase n=1 Tax=Prauserella flavalba TaxID=1477506 RepID=A0A318LXR0_9PSEU|nr:NUDIX hydrolase [Prauserella flavalba]PXY33890.1 7,8-dihydro-8-oxoguanine-triphosphatase [Prauserella flavalba]
MAVTAEKHLVYCWLERAGAVLLLRRAPGTFLGGNWELPGGTVEPGEAPESAAVREIAEETGLAVTVTGERGRYTWMDITGRALRVHAVVYESRETGRAEVVLNPAEHDGHAWLSRGDARELPMAPHFAETLELGAGR